MALDSLLANLREQVVDSFQKSLLSEGAVRRAVLVGEKVAVGWGAIDTEVILQCLQWVGCGGRLWGPVYVFSSDLRLGPRYSEYPCDVTFSVGNLSDCAAGNVCGCIKVYLIGKSELP